uniref:Uncharacterized protein n=1 Tax=Rhodopseudomonas palustris (strain BisA53) TaxID=316055 RepID=Q07IG3_RHOP5
MPLLRRKYLLLQIDHHTISNCSIVYVFESLCHIHGCLEGAQTTDCFGNDHATFSAIGENTVESNCQTECTSCRTNNKTCNVGRESA